MVKKAICLRHDDIIHWAKEIAKLTDSKKIKRFTDKIVKEAKAARESGASMEDRLSVYRYTIENLGFKRK